METLIEMIWEVDDGRVRCVRKNGAMKMKKKKWRGRRSREEDEREQENPKKKHRCGFEFIGKWVII